MQPQNQQPPVIKNQKPAVALHHPPTQTAVRPQPSRQARPGQAGSANKAGKHKASCLAGCMRPEQGKSPRGWPEPEDRPKRARFLSVRARMELPDRLTASSCLTEFDACNRAMFCSLDANHGTVAVCFMSTMAGRPGRLHCVAGLKCIRGARFGGTSQSDQAVGCSGMQRVTSGLVGWAVACPRGTAQATECLLISNIGRPLPDPIPLSS